MGARHLTLEDRKKMETMYAKNCTAAEIAAALSVCKSTIYHELRRGYTGNMDENGRPGYYAVTAQKELLRRYYHRTISPKKAMKCKEESEDAQK